MLAADECTHSTNNINPFSFPAMLPAAQAKKGAAQRTLGSVRQTATRIQERLLFKKRLPPSNKQLQRDRRQAFQ